MELRIHSPTNSYTTWYETSLIPRPFWHGYTDLTRLGGEELGLGIVLLTGIDWFVHKDYCTVPFFIRSIITTTVSLFWMYMSQMPTPYCVRWVREFPFQDHEMYINCRQPIWDGFPPDLSGLLIVGLTMAGGMVVMVTSLVILICWGNGKQQSGYKS